MSTQRPITFAVAVCGTDEIVEDNFLASPSLRRPHPHQIILQKDYTSAARAYNDAINRAQNDLMVFAHQDMIFPRLWLSQLEEAIAHLEAADPRWGVLGCYGMTQGHRGEGYIFQPGRGTIGRVFESPIPVQTLDEIVLVFKKSSGLRFDDQLPHFHLYGADICLRAAELGMNSYAVPAFCIHNANQYVVLPKEFYECCHYIRRVWRDHLPIQTTCLAITRLNLPMYRRRLLEVHLRYIRRKTFIAPRAKDVPQLLKQVASVVPGI
jgi:hypothetical protein